MFACNTLLVRSTIKGWETSSTLFLRVVEKRQNVRRKNAVENKRKRAEWRRRQSARVRRERTRREGWWCWSFFLVSRWEKRGKQAGGGRAYTQQRKTHRPPTVSEKAEAVCLTTLRPKAKALVRLRSPPSCLSFSLHDYKFIIIPYISLGPTTTSSSILIHSQCVQCWALTVFQCSGASDNFLTRKTPPTFGIIIFPSVFREAESQRDRSAKNEEETSFFFAVSCQLLSHFLTDSVYIILFSGVCSDEGTRKI